MQICKDCGYYGSTKKKATGSFGNEISLWVCGLLFLIIFFPIGVLILAVAVIYSLYRMIAPCDKVCPKCKHKDTMIPEDSPAGQKLIEDYKIKKQ